MTKHTATPWRITKDAQGICGLLHPTKEGVAVAWFSSTFRPANGFVGEEECELGRPEREANARFIVRAVNAHDELVAALEKIAEGRGAFDTDQLTFANNVISESQSIARAALKKAGRGE